MADQNYSLEELAEESGIDKRVIRSLIEQGLLLGPDSRGRYARYTTAHLDRLLAIKTLRESRKLTLEEVRQTLLSMSDADVSSLAHHLRHQTERQPKSQSETSSVLEYLRSARGEPPGPRAQSRASESPPRSSSPVDALLHALSRVVHTSRVRRQVRGEHWHRFQVTPDVELSVKGLRDAGQIEQWERISDSLRDILLGGSRHE